ncbi:hypothetical protein AJ80_02241 [Polytolypa hystricis UAMH7299]|uniref:Nucleoporin Nup82 n=1 Tax=Polytolypa hystricis (strain UAMH7299) TaxID=1447883 RepID=A0A2B7YQP4_POLH7|nr:hypothetical protein AJ80_02241 [Polytolypa hystricis UAMH7299]
MPKIIDYAPPWLSRPSPGANFFLERRPELQSPQASRTGAKGRDVDTKREAPYDGPTRTIARRGTEVFAVVDNQIRWANLATLKDEWQVEVRQKRRNASRGGGRADEAGGEPGTPSSRSRDDDEGPESHYRILTVPFYGQIKQLIASPNGAFLAIVTPQTIHIAVLPDSAHLSGPDFSPMKLKTFQLGPTTHVLPESPVVSAIWHPLGVYDNQSGCIVTVTQDAAVRMWEIDRSNHWSFDRPTLAVDLKKLVDGTSLDEDFTPSGFGQNKGFSADLFDMEVASACFGGNGVENEDAWAAMTLWIAMRPGDTYALCPLLPSKWQAPSLTVPSLTSSIIHKPAATQDETSEADEDEQRVVNQQYEWLKEIDNQEPLQNPDTFSDVEIRARPANPSAIPRLQGPFQIDLGDEYDDLDVTDIFVIAAKADVDDLLAGEDLYDEPGSEGVSGTLIALVTATGRVYISLELDGVEGQWLSKTCKNAFTTPLSNPSELLLLETLETVREKYQQPHSWPTFTPDAQSRYSFFITTSNNVTFLSLSSWAERLETELQSPDNAGSAFRIKVLCDGSMALREQILQITDQESTSRNGYEHLPSSLVMYDFDLGYLLLTYSSSRIHAVILDSPSLTDFALSKDLTPFDSDISAQQPLAVAPKRSPYQVPSILYTMSPLASFIEEHVPHGHKHTLREPVRLSPSTLDLITAAHRILSAHTYALERAASDLFRRCERLQGEMNDQLHQLAEIAERVNDVSNGIGGEEEVEQEDGRRKLSGPERNLDSRLAAAQSRQEQLVERYNNIRNRIAKAGGRPLGEKEKGWVSEVDKLSGSLGQSEKVEPGELAHRLRTAKSLSQDLLSEARHISEVSATPSTPGTPSSGHGAPKIPHRLQKAKIAEAMNMVERESAVIEAITAKLDRLHASVFDT